SLLLLDFDLQQHELRRGENDLSPAGQDADLPGEHALGKLREVEGGGVPPGPTTEACGNRGGHLTPYRAGALTRLPQSPARPDEDGRTTWGTAGTPPFSAPASSGPYARRCCWRITGARIFCCWGRSGIDPWTAVDNRPDDTPSSRQQSERTIGDAVGMAV